MVATNPKTATKNNMKQFTVEQLQDQFTKLPKDLQEAISSTEVHDSILKIGSKYGLHVDQLGEMVDLVGLIMLGLSSSKSFVRDFSQQSGVKEDIALSIAEDVNSQVFGKIRMSMQSIEKAAEEPKDSSLADLERVGGFSIEPALAENGNGVAMPADLPGMSGAAESQEDLVSSIENPPPAKQVNLMAEADHTDSLVDHLLAGPSGAAEHKTSKTVEPPAGLPGEEPADDILPQKTAAPAQKPESAPQAPKKPSGPDLYREPTV